MDWDRDLKSWPNSDYSSLIDSQPHRWHVQSAGVGPTILLIHGAGGATQSWRSLFPRLIPSAHVVAVDLPGQGFTRMGTRQRCGLRPVSEDIAALCATQNWEPALIVGHSAGAAIALELADRLSPRGVVGINAALGRFEGMAGWLFPALAKVLALNPLVPSLFARLSGNEKRVRDLLATTGSTLDEGGFQLYQRLISDRGHVDGTLAMMAQWDVDPLLARLDDLDIPTLFIVGTRDGTVPPETSTRAARRMPNATVVEVSGRGHLVHEEVPDKVAGLVLEFARSHGLALTAPA
jgi:magnesium chelatase accessory protein